MNNLKKTIATICVMMLFAPITFAKTFKVESLTSFSTDKYPSTVKMRALEDINLSQGVHITEGSVMTGKLVDVKSPKRLKRNAKFSFMPTSYVNDSGATVALKESFEGKYTTKLEISKGQVAKSAALSVGNHFVKGLSMGYYAVEGAVKNDDGNRLKSSATSLYEHSPASYIEKGQDIIIVAGDVFGLKFKVDDELEEEALVEEDGKVHCRNFEYTPAEIQK